MKNVIAGQTLSIVERVTVLSQTEQLLWRITPKTEFGCHKKQTALACIKLCKNPTISRAQYQKALYELVMALSFLVQHVCHIDDKNVPPAVRNRLNEYGAKLVRCYQQMTQSIPDKERA